jgi:NifU-like protein involved in Fe-S cluster formation
MIDALYSDRILKLAANMPRAGRLAAPQGSAERVAKLCGSTAIVDVVLDDEGRVADFAQDIRACALGQATAAIVGESVIGASVEELETAAEQMRAMLKGGGPAPTGRFAGLALLETVRDYPARHASSMIPLEAAAAAARAAFEGARPDAKPASTLAGRARDRTRLAGAA